MSLIRVYFRIESRFYNKCWTTIVLVAIINSRCILVIMQLHYWRYIEYWNSKKDVTSKHTLLTLLFLMIMFLSEIRQLAKTTIHGSYKYILTSSASNITSSWESLYVQHKSSHHSRKMFIINANVYFKFMWYKL